MARETLGGDLARDILLDPNAMSHRRQFMPAFHIIQKALDNAPMHKRDLSQGERFARAIEGLCREKAESEPGELLLHPLTGALHHNRLAAHITKTTRYRFGQPTLSRILKGKVSNPSNETLQALSAYFGLTIPQLRALYEGTETSAKSALSVAQIAIAEKWGALPPRARRYVAEQIDALSRLLKEDPSLLKAIVSSAPPLPVGRPQRRNAGHHQ